MMVQLVPSQCSVSVSPLLLPTAQMSFVEMAAIPDRVLCESNGGWFVVGLEMMLQLVPFHCSISGTSVSKSLSTPLPTAQTLVGESARILFPPPKVNVCFSVT